MAARQSSSAVFRVALAMPLLFAASAAGPARPTLPEVKIGVVVDGPWKGNESVLALSRQEVLVLTEGEFAVTFPATAYLVGDWTLETAQENLQRLLADPEIDLVITWGVLASHSVCCYGSLPKPVVAPVVIDATLQGLPQREGASGIRNLTYVALPDNLLRDLTTFREMVPFDKVTILMHDALLEAIPDLPLRTRPMADRLGLDYEYIGAGLAAGPVLDAISEDTGGVYIWPLFHMADEEYARLIAGLNEHRLPTFSALGGEDLELGMLASLASEEFFPRLTRRVALDVQRILLGEEPGQIPVGFSTRDKLTINMGTARRIGVSPTWNLLIEAEVLDMLPLEGVERRILEEVVATAIEANLDLRAQRRTVAAGRQEVARAGSLLLPRVELAGRGTTIDSRRAEASFGTQAERTWSASATLTQLLWSDPASANLEIQRELQIARREELEELRLDIALDAVVSYLNVLRAGSLVQVRRNNLEVSRSNLELARIRRTIGAANPAEVFRWESAIATDRKVLIEAVGDLSVAKIALNRVMSRDQGIEFVAADVGLDDPGLMTGDRRFVGYTETPRRFEVFTAFMVREGLAASPELKQVDAAIAAQERAAKAARRSYWAPELGLQASLEEILSESGAGAEQLPDFTLFPLAEPDDTRWSVALQATFALFTGGGRAADRIEAEEELGRLRELRAATRERVEQRIRTTMARTRSSFPGVELSRQAAAAARKNLDLVGDAYARGAVSITDLLDAQTAALNADELATNSVYDFLVDLMQAERAANRFDLFLSREEKDVWFLAIADYFEAQGIPPLGPGQRTTHGSPPE